ncbi:MAG: hypothetical protein ABT00_21730 [Bordetella sp. SCN 68-11]|nr:MAG: hypothetical protein ABT00_21730 [Bordetella sp. SCN 68-11]
MRQPAGIPARSRLSPVVLPTSHACRRSRDAGDRVSPTVSLPSVRVMAWGVVVSSMPVAWGTFSSGS